MASFTFALITGLVVLFILRLTEARNAALAEAARARVQQFMLNLFQGGDKKKSDAGPPEDMRVVTLIDRGVEEAGSLGKEPQVQAELYQTLGIMFQRLGKLDRADSLLQLSLKERRSQQDYRALASNLIALGLLRSEKGQSKEAERIMREALALINPHESHNQALLANANFGLGRVMVDSGQYTQAVVILNQVVQTQSEQDSASPELAKSLNALADANLYLGHYDIAASLNQRVLAIDQNIYGANHPRVGEDLHNLAEFRKCGGAMPKQSVMSGMRLRIPGDGDQHSELMSITIPK